MPNDILTALAALYSAAVAIAGIYTMATLAAMQRRMDREDDDDTTN